VYPAAGGQGDFSGKPEILTEIDVMYKK